LFIVISSILFIENNKKTKRITIEEMIIPIFDLLIIERIRKIIETIRVIKIIINK